MMETGFKLLHSSLTGHVEGEGKENHIISMTVSLSVIFLTKHNSTDRLRTFAVLTGELGG